MFKWFSFCYQIIHIFSKLFEFTNNTAKSVLQHSTGAPWMFDWKYIQAYTWTHTQKWNWRKQRISVHFVSSFFLIWSINGSVYSVGPDTDWISRSVDMFECVFVCLCENITFKNRWISQNSIEKSSMCCAMSAIIKTLVYHKNESIWSFNKPLIDECSSCQYIYIYIYWERKIHRASETNGIYTLV